MWIPYVDWSPRTKSMFPNKSKVQRVEKVEKSAKPENDLNKRRHRRVPPTTFSAILFDALKQGVVMINTYGVRKMSSIEYYKVFQEVQAAKELARVNVQTQLATHEREKHMISANENQNNDVMAPRKWGSNLDVKAQQ